MRIVKRSKLQEDTIAVSILIVGYLYLCFRGFIPCWWYEVTGLRCAGCGGCHLVQALLRGDIMEAFRYNAFIFVSAPIIVPLSLLLRDNLKTIWISYAILLVVWSIIRNIGGF